LATPRKGKYFHPNPETAIMRTTRSGSFISLQRTVFALWLDLDLAITKMERPDHHLDRPLLLLIATVKSPGSLLGEDKEQAGAHCRLGGQAGQAEFFRVQQQGLRVAGEGVAGVRLPLLERPGGKVVR